uniref:Uncharacterized protein n=1 Tax=Knipowitschia caucasica TaxID=637954 RepID=A0AAV2K4V4_KNICA
MRPSLAPSPSTASSCFRPPSPTSFLRHSRFPAGGPVGAGGADYLRALSTTEVGSALPPTLWHSQLPSKAKRLQDPEQALFPGSPNPVLVALPTFPDAYIS